MVIKILKIVSLLAASIFIAPCSLLGHNQIDSLSIKLAEYMNSREIAGMAVAIVSPDSVLYAKAFGYSDREKQVPYTLNTVQPIASISKTLIGISAMKAQELGMLNLDDDINKYLPFAVINPRFPNETITIRHLATHTSGLKDCAIYEKAYIFSEKIPPLHRELGFGIKRLAFKRYIKRYNGNLDMPVEEFLRKIYNADGEWYRHKYFGKKGPGKSYEYSNNGAALAALAIEKAAGIDYKSFVREYITNPLQMSNSSWSVNDFDESQRSALYMHKYRIPHYKLITFADGGFVTSISDFCRFLMAVMRGYQGEDNIISPESYHEMLSPQVLPDSKTGIFWDISPKSIGHTGGDPGVQTLAYFSKNGAVGVVIFLNTSELALDSRDLVDVLNIINKR